MELRVFIQAIIAGHGKNFNNRMTWMNECIEGTFGRQRKRHTVNREARNSRKYFSCRSSENIKNIGRRSALSVDKCETLKSVENNFHALFRVFLLKACRKNTFVVASASHTLRIPSLTPDTRKCLVNSRGRQFDWRPAATLARKISTSFIGGSRFCSRRVVKARISRSCGKKR